MGLFNNLFPYSDFHELNLDWILKEFVNVHTELENTKLYVDNGKLYIDGKLADATYQAELATLAKTAAQNAQASAESARDAAAGSATAAAGSATAAAGSATQAAQTVSNTLNQINVLQSRVDNIIPDGTQTEGNTELLDIRVGGNGITYDSAGNAVRGQYDEVSGELLQNCKRTYNSFNKYKPIIIPNLTPQESTHKFVYSYTTSLLVIPIAKNNKKTVQFISNFNAAGYSVTAGAVLCDDMPELNSDWLYKSACVYSSTQIRGYVSSSTDAEYLVFAIAEGNAHPETIIDLITPNLCVVVHDDIFAGYDEYPYIDYYILDVNDSCLSDDILHSRVKVIDTINIKLGAELFTNEISGSYTNWSGNRNSGYTHTAGSDDAIAFDSFNTVAGDIYLVEFNTTYNQGEFGTIYFGDSYHNLCYNGTYHIIIPLVSDGGYLRFKPKASWNGVISNLSVKRISEAGTDYTLTLNSVLSYGHENLYNYWNVVLGNECMNNAVSSSRSIAIGYHTLRSLLGGHRNVAVGSFAMSQTTGAESNVSIGCDSMLSVTSAEENVVIGKGALYYGNEQKENVAIGAYALVAPDSTGSENNVAVGYQAGYGNDGDNNVFIGHKSGFESSGSNMVVIGNAATETVIIGNKTISFNNDGTVTWS